MNNCLKYYIEAQTPEQRPQLVPKLKQEIEAVEPTNKGNQLKYDLVTLLYLIEPTDTLAEYLFENDITKPIDKERYTKSLRSKCFDSDMEQAD